MLKGKSNTASVAPRGIHVSTSIYAKAVKLVYGLCQITPDLIWYNDWKVTGSPTNGALFQVTGSSSKKKGSKKGSIKYYSAAVDILLGHAPLVGILTAWYNNQRLGVQHCSSSGFVSGDSFHFTPSAGESIAKVVVTLSGLSVSVPDFVSDGQTTQNNTGVFDDTRGRWLVSSDPTLSPGPNQYTVDDAGNYAFNAAQLGHSVTIIYRKFGGGTAGVLAGIFAVSINEAIPVTMFNDFGAPGSVTVAGHWDRPLWNKAFPVPGLIDAGSNAARDPYSWSADPGGDSTVTFPDSRFDGMPVTVYYGVPVINKADGTFYSSHITPLALLNLEFEAACGSGSEYVNHSDQQDINAWCCGAGSTSFDLGTANAMPNLLLEAIGAFTCWPNGDAHVADIITDIVMSGPILPAMVPHGANCNDYDNGGPPGCGVLLGEVVSSGSPPSVIVAPEALEGLHNWCCANGISAALNQDTQRTAKDMLDELTTLGNSAPVYSGDTLKLVPYDEVSTAGYGSIYVAPTASGPVVDLTDVDFARDDKGAVAPVILTRKSRTSCDNAVSLEYVSRDLDYVQAPVTDVDAMAVALYGPRKGGELDSAQLGIGNPSGSKLLRSISNSAVAQQIASVLTKRSATGVDSAAFTLDHRYFWIEAMDLVWLTDSRLGLVKVPFRLTSVKETPQRTYQCEADKFVYGLNHPTIKGVAAGSGSLVTGSGDPGVVNEPIIFQPTCVMTANDPEVWFVVSGADPNYGGCVVFASIDGGESYDAIGRCGAATTGELTAEFASSSPEVDPDTTHTLSVDLSESGGELTSQSQAVADANLDQCYLSIDSGSPLVPTGFEIVCPTDAVVTAPYKYDLNTYIRRACKDSSYSTHPIGTRFAVLDGAVFTVELVSYWVGRTVMFKFAAYNKLGGQQQSLADCVVYTFSPKPSCGFLWYGRLVTNEVVAFSGTAGALANGPTAGTQVLYRNGQRLTPGAGLTPNDYTISGANCTLTVAAGVNDAFLADYWNGNSSWSGTLVENEVVTFSGTAGTLASTPIAGTQALYRNGMRLTPGAGNDYTISGDNITLTVTAGGSDAFLANYWKSGTWSGMIVANEVVAFSGIDGTLANTPIADTQVLYRNGQRLTPGVGKDYTISGAAITLTVAAGGSDAFIADYSY
jgi:hypothetical protein